jgi:pyruvate/2-oxoglutarate dehydrogenase complex dihydrolipoamide dehydrogenase (E3) component
MKDSKRSTGKTEKGSSAQLPKMTNVEEYDLVVLGFGTGAKVAAWTTAEQGKRVALIERKYIGGSCHNIACCQARTSFTVRRSRRTCAEAESSA